MPEQTESIAFDADGVGESRTFGEGGGHALSTAGDGGRMVAVASRLRVRAVRLAAMAKRRGNGNPAAAGSVLINMAFYLVYALLVVRLTLGIFAGSPDEGFVVTVAMAAFMILHGIVNRVRAARRYHEPDRLRLWYGRLL